MKHSGQCPKCNSTNIVHDAKALDHTESYIQMDMQIGVERNPKAWMFKGQATSSVSAWVCGDCGYLEFYADDPAKLADAADEAERQ